MSHLVYTSICSLDGYAADVHGDFSWSQPDEEVHRFVNDRERGIGTYLLGRRLYEVMKVWEEPDFAEGEEILLDYAAVWQAADKVVYSSSLEAVSTPRTRLERTFDADEVRALVQSADAPVSVGGPTLAEHALRAGLVDELQLYVVPWVIGGGLAVLPDGFRVQLDLQEEHRFESGVLFLRYTVRN